VESVIMKAKGCTKSVQVAQTSWMTSCAWQIDSTQCFTITFQSFANGKRLVTKLLLPKVIQNLFTYAEGFKVHVSLCILLKLREMKFIYRAMHACIEFKLKISDRKKSFPRFVDNLN